MRQSYLKLIDELSDQNLNLPWKNKEFYTNWLTQTYFYVCHSTKLLNLAAANTSDEKYYRRLIAHIKEEFGHEKLALSDLNALDVQIESFQEQSITKAFYLSQYSITQRNPFALLGYILALELLAARHLPKILPIVENEFGNRATVFIREHSEEDQHHIESAFKIMDGLSPHDTKEVTENIKFSLDIYNLMLSEVLKGMGTKDFRKLDQKNTNVVMPL